MVEDEVHQIFSAQRKLNRSFATPELETSYLDILLGQRSFDDGPGSGPYSGNQVERMIGKCTFEKDELRAAKATYSFEYFTLLEKVNHIRLHTPQGLISLSPHQRLLLIEEAHKSDKLSYSRIRKLLQLPEDQTFNTVRYTHDAPLSSCEEKVKFAHLKAYHKMRAALAKVCKDRISQLSLDQKNQIGRILSIYKTSDKIRPALLAADLTAADVDALESISGFSGFGHLSITACEKLIPHLERGLNYHEACHAAGYNFKAHDGTERSLYLNAQSEQMESLTSPVVLRSIAQTVKVVNAIIRRQGCSPTYINIELARELSRSFSERKNADREMEQNRVRNEKALQRIQAEFGKDSPTGQDLVKLKLYEEQGGVCPYSGKQMSLTRLFSDMHYAEVDHIIPYSISFDDSYKNKVLVLAEENRNKGNRLPLQYLTGKRREDFIVWTNSTVRDYRKRTNLLKEVLTEEDEARFKERNLQDTKTVSRFLYNYINDTLKFAPSATMRKLRVTAVNGTVTSYIRKRWGISKIRENGDLHHAVDALIVACTTSGMIQQISRYTQYRECEYMLQEDGSYAIDRKTGEVLRRFPYPWPAFRQELEARLSSNPARAVMDLHLPFYLTSGQPISLRPPFVSRVPRRKVTGAAHKDTVKGAREWENGYVIVKRPLTSLKLDSNGGIQGYYDPSSDRLLYDALCAQLKKFGGNAAAAFADPFHKPKSDGTPGPLVNKVKLVEKSTLNVPVQGGTGVADHDTMVRIDVFYVENDGYYFVPIYVADTLRHELPNKACIANKPYDMWKEMQAQDFLFSLYPNDLIRITHRSGVKLTVRQSSSTLPPTRQECDTMFYYLGADISVGSITAITHDASYRTRIGIKTLQKLEKYTVDVLGEYHLVHKEVRQPFYRKEGS